MVEIRTVIRDQGLKNTQLLEVMAKQQSEAQAAAAAAMIAQNEALKSFQETIASVVVPLSQRPPTAVHLPEKDPKFQDWDGDRTHLLLWLHQVDQIRQTKEITDTGCTFCPKRHGRCGIWTFQGGTTELGSVRQGLRGPVHDFRHQKQSNRGTRQT